jgi:hypothetical protein
MDMKASEVAYTKAKESEIDVTAKHIIATLNISFFPGSQTSEYIISVKK